MTILGGLDDQTLLLTWGNVSKCLFSKCPSNLSDFYVYKDIFSSFIRPLQSNQPILSLVVSRVLYLFGSNSLLIMFIIAMLLNLIFSYLLFSKSKFGLVYSIIFTFSAYAWSHFGIHIDLMQMWVLPLFIHFTLEYQDTLTVKRIVLLSTLLTIVILISNYYGFILLVFLFCYSLSKLFVDRLVLGKPVFRFIIPLKLVFLLTFVFTTFTLLPYIKANYIRNGSTQSAGLSAVRPFEDFITFSSRPWYFFIPPVKNPVLGSIAKISISKISHWNYFLADDYFSAEHSGNYFGMLFLISVVFLSLYIFKKYRTLFNKKLLTYIISSILLLSFMMPPFFTVSGLKIYTPGLLIYKIFPMFRVASRLSTVVLLLLLLVLAESMELVYKNCSTNGKKVLGVLISVLTLVTLIETYIPPKIYLVPAPSQSFVYLSKNTSYKTIFAVYPNDKSQEALFNLPVHERFLLNPKDYRNKKFYSPDFTKSLVTPGGLQTLQQLGGEYLIVFKDVKETDIIFFKNSNLIELEQEFADSYVFKVLHEIDKKT